MGQVLVPTQHHKAILTAARYREQRKFKVGHNSMDRRHERRWRTDVHGSCLFQGNQDILTISEISSNGCRLHGHLSHLKTGDPIKIIVGNIGPLDAVIRWSTANAAGVEFQERLEHGVVAYFAAFCRTAA